VREFYSKSVFSLILLPESHFYFTYLFRIFIVLEVLGSELRTSQLLKQALYYLRHMHSHSHTFKTQFDHDHCLAENL
jgi:hypothetical protein